MSRAKILWFSESGEHSHQGGFNRNASLDSVEIPLDSATSGIEFGQIVSYSLSLKESLREVLSSLRKQREKLRRTPSIQYILDRESETLTLR